MITCGKCLSEVPDTSRFCLNCGNPVSTSGPEDATIAIDAFVPTPSPTPSSGSAVLLSGAATRLATLLPKAGRFQPGTVLAGRYQIIGLVGKGGMGEVYRANDLTLDQAVALKFLPENMVTNPAMLARFHGEVRIARQVSHPNVCRVYDIGEIEGQLFLSMEYVDGEDLGSLLRRIGRLPSDKAIEFARKICAGLAAAHDKGVLHRDLKPANIMIDSQGQVVVMDFGLAAVADQIVGLEIKAGTPAYMSPEQLAGREVTVRSDIYALGLVLFEMFTGRRAFECGSLAELMRMQFDTEALSVSSVAKDVDPAVGKVIVRCLAPEAKDRPASALSVAAALPGGDPLAAALAAGETPSPELVAASGETAGMRPAWAVTCAAAVLLALVLIAFLGPLTRVLCMAPMDLPPDALALRAREILDNLGYTQKPSIPRAASNTIGIFCPTLERKATPIAGPTCRTRSPRPSTSGTGRARSTWSLARIAVGSPSSDPPPLMSGMSTVELDPRGRLTRFSAVPPQVDPAPAPAAFPDWFPLFKAAGLDISKFTPTSPTWTPLAAIDARAAWTGTWPDMPDKPLRVEAAAWRGRPVYFETIGPWTRPGRMERAEMSSAQRSLQFVLLFLSVTMLLAASLLARYNLRRGRGDRKGAIRLAAVAFFVSMAIWALGADHVPTADEVFEMFVSLSMSLLLGASLWVGYMALEPYVRRHWPGAIVSWTRLMAGGYRDPLVGRDVLIGVVFGMFWASIWATSVFIEISKSGPSAESPLVSILGPRQTLTGIALAIPGSFIQLFAVFLFLFFLRIALRKHWLAAAVFIALLTVFGSAGSKTPLIDGALGLLIAGTIYLALTEFGFITYTVAAYINSLIVMMPVTHDFTVWYSGASGMTMLTVAALTAWGMHSALAGRSIIHDDLL